MVGVGLAYWVTDGGCTRKPALCATDDEDLAVRKVEKFGHGASFEHVFYFPAFFDTLGRELDTTALRRCRHLRGEVFWLNGRIDGLTTAYEYFGRVVWRREWE